MSFIKSWRWFGPGDPVALEYLKQIGIESVVTALHHIPNGEVWPVDEILKRKNEIEHHGMKWFVVESLPVHESIKMNSPGSERLLANYRQSLQNLAQCGITTVVYNFMPVLDWIRTDLHYQLPCGGESMLFHYPAFVAFDAFILKRPGALNEYPPETLQKAEALFHSMGHEQREQLAYTIIVVTQGFIDGLVKGGKGDYKQMFLEHLQKYSHIGREELRTNLKIFLDAVLPVATSVGISLAIHPDDPPYPVLGLPRIAGTAEDFRWLVSLSGLPEHGITFCTGSLSARRDNDITNMVREFAPRVKFLHLRNTAWKDEETFYESGHLEGSVDMFEVMKVMWEEQNRRKNEGHPEFRIPLRPDHGIKILTDGQLATHPGYPLAGRLKGLAELAGIEYALRRIYGY